eukprot:CAMPEP_0174380630 /NCGR_PEP_ID=MMETSP0811_2-20130205/123496_1 /TAXON_ID=73025 ORGANISM="Eutreptiella gymnastica-like, Strain CCMP1594" /NCGR_SAMPLE_ID=MMETSP0811_2 /ASSEMBLY_ACC=CAM_ASM_000667 /LENGTH=187 /DNA_ID=CAMNT_0015533551 /DNA_START=722 /DNA_END=1285 /DNA_ORIENTATION=-
MTLQPHVPAPWADTLRGLPPSQAVQKGEAPKEEPAVAQGAFSHSAGWSVHGEPYQQGLWVQNSGPWDPWLPVLENSRLFAQLAHSAQCAPAAAPACVLSFQGRGCTVATNPTSAHVPAHSGLYGGWLSAQNPHPFDGTLIVVAQRGKGAVASGVGWGRRWCRALARGGHGGLPPEEPSTPADVGHFV